MVRTRGPGASTWNGQRGTRAGLVVVFRPFKATTVVPGKWSLSSGYRFGYTAGYRNFRNAGRHLPEALEMRVSRGYLGECPTLSAIVLCRMLIFRFPKLEAFRQKPSPARRLNTPSLIENAKETSSARPRSWRR